MGLAICSASTEKRCFCKMVDESYRAGQRDHVVSFFQFVSIVNSFFFSVVSKITSFFSPENQ